MPSLPRSMTMGLQPPAQAFPPSNAVANKPAMRGHFRMFMITVLGIGCESVTGSGNAGGVLVFVTGRRHTHREFFGGASRGLSVPDTNTDAADTDLVSALH